MIRMQMAEPPDDATQPPGRDADQLAQRLLAGDQRALARAITLVESGAPAAAALVREIYPRTGGAAVIGLTGPPGAGKSTLIGALTRTRRQAGERVGVLAIDPSSPFTQGALLGDRIRLSEHFLDAGVFIRSMATRGALGGLSEAALQALRLIDAAGYRTVLLESVGVGQAEVDIASHADTVVLVLMPGSGDSVQALKAGVMEIPDVIVVNKADDPRAATLARELKAVLGFAPPRDWPVPIVQTEALTANGVEQLDAQLQAHRAHLTRTGGLAARRARNLRAEALQLATSRLRAQLEAALAADPATGALLARVAERKLDPASAADQLVYRLDRGRR